MSDVYLFQSGKCSQLEDVFKSCGVPRDVFYVPMEIDGVWYDRRYYFKDTEYSIDDFFKAFEALQETMNDSLLNCVSASEWLGMVRTYNAVYFYRTRFDD